jgi:hypothetical protein
MPARAGQGHRAAGRLSATAQSSARDFDYSSGSGWASSPSQQCTVPQPPHSGHVIIVVASRKRETGWPSLSISISPIPKQVGQFIRSGSSSSRACGGAICGAALGSVGSGRRHEQPGRFLNPWETPDPRASPAKHVERPKRVMPRRGRTRPRPGGRNLGRFDWRG